MQDSLTMLCCGAVFGILALAIVLAILKKRGPVSVQPSMPAEKPPSKSVDGKHRVQTKSVEGKHRLETKSVEGKHLADTKSVEGKRKVEEKPVRSKRVIDEPRTKDASKKQAPSSSKSDFRPAPSKGKRSKSTYKQAGPSKRDTDEGNPHLRKD